MNKYTHKRIGGIACLMAISAGLTLLPKARSQQVRQDFQIGPVRAQVEGALIDDLSKQDEDSNSTGGATLKTDPDLESILKKAERYQQDGNFGVACQLWQAVLDRSGDTLYSLDNQTYFSMIEQVEKTLSGLPPDGLRVYRITADAAARQILAQAPTPEDAGALSEVVRKYFVSSLGDDAAFRLACQCLDRFDFVGALRLLKKIDSHHPDSSIPRYDILARSVLCQILMGDLNGAEQSLRKATTESANADPGIQAVRELLTKAQAGGLPGFEAFQVANFRQFRVGPKLPADALSDDLTAVWQAYVEPQEVYNAKDRIDRILVSANSKVMEDSVNSNERSLIERWSENAWRPVGQLRLSADKMLFKSPIDMTAWSTKLDSKSVWRSLWLNNFELDDATRMLQVIRLSYGNQRGLGSNLRRPDSIDQTLIFGDLVHGQYSVFGSVVYSIEGQHPDTVSHRDPKNQGIPWNSTYRRSRNNSLCAYEADSGRLIWTLPRGNSGATAARAPEVAGNEPEYLQSGGFMGAPIQFGNSLVVPVNQGGAIFIYALDLKQRGKTLWKTYLCDEPDTGAEPWAPIQLALDGSDLFAPTGMGVVFVLDPATGAIRFAQRYTRIGSKNDIFRNIGYQMNRMDFDGWSEDQIIPYGRQMICFASDTNRIFAIDRNTGKLIWETDMNPLGQKLDYILGICDDKLFAAGRQTMIAFDLKGEGRMLWGGDDLFEGATSLGRGVLTEDAIYIPVQDTIWKFGLQGNGGRADRQAVVHASLPVGAPVGNLASDGQRLWAHQGTRIIALGPQNEKE